MRENAGARVMEHLGSEEPERRAPSVSFAESDSYSLRGGDDASAARSRRNTRLLLTVTALLPPGTADSPGRETEFKKHS